MAFLKFDEIFDLTSTFTTHVSQSCVVSDSGVTGSVKLSAFEPGTLRQVDYTERFFPITPWGITGFLSTYDQLRNGISSSIYTGGATDFFATAELFLDETHQLPEFARDNKSFCVTRFVPDWEVTSALDTSGNSYNVVIDSSGSTRKNYIRKNLYEQYRGIYRQCNWAYTNYHTLNFFTSSVTNNDSVIIYPSPTSSVDSSARYRPDGPFTFEFWINPRYTSDSETAEFNAGTILHYSSAYAVSLLTGSSRDVNGLPDKYRLLLQLSSSADTNPSQIAVSSLPELTYASADNSLIKNNWHHVAVRWGGEEFNNYTGSFVIDGEISSEFVIPSSSITFQSPATSYQGFSGKNNADALFVGNFYEGSNTGNDIIGRFFNSSVGTNEGLEVLESGETQDPENFSFNNKLNAEIHELRFYKTFRDLKTIEAERYEGLGGNSLEVTSSQKLSLYVPPFFTKESPNRLSLSFDINRIATVQRASETPFNVSASFGPAGLDINVENFVRDFANEVYPRLYKLTGSVSEIAGPTGTPAKQLLLGSITSNTRNFTVLPSDNGLFTPQYKLLKSGTVSIAPITGTNHSRYVNDNGILDFSLISLNRMLNGRSGFKGETPNDNNLYEPEHFYESFGGPVETEGGVDVISYSDNLNVNPMWNITYNAEDINSPFRPRKLSTTYGSGSNTFLYMHQLYGDESSNEVVMFNIPQIMYGNRVEPGTFIVSETALTGTGGKVNITLKDDGYGSLYRADAATTLAKNASVGNIFYDHGIAVVKTPHLPYFGSGSFSTSFKGSQNTHVREIMALAPKNLVNSSSNPTYLKLIPSDNANEISDEFVYVTTVTLHDENLNVIGRANLSQPLKKRPTDEFMFKLKLDY